MTIPDYQSLMLPVLTLAAKQEVRVPEAAEIIADQFGITPEERETMLPSGRQRLLHNRIHWAKFYMSKAGLLESPRRGQFVATEAGRTLLRRNPKRIDVATLAEFPGFLDFYSGQNGSREEQTHAPPPEAKCEEVATASATPEEQIETAQSSLLAALRGDLLARILQATPSFFEGVIIDLLVAMGYGGNHKYAATQLGRSGDGGVDGVINEDRLGLDRVYVQAKRYAPGNTVGRPEVQGFVGSLVGLGATKGVFVTTSSFSPPAVQFVQHLPQRVVLIDGQRLADLMIEHDVGVRVSRSIELKRLDEDYFSEEV